MIADAGRASWPVCARTRNLRSWSRFRQQRCASPFPTAPRVTRAAGHGYGIGQLFRALAHHAAELRFRSGDHALRLWGDAPSLTGQVELAQKAWLDGLVLA